jgi:hypothetical protein
MSVNFQQATRRYVPDDITVQVYFRSRCTASLFKYRCYFHEYMAYTYIHPTGLKLSVYV